MEHATLCIDHTFGILVMVVWIVLAGALFSYAWVRSDLWRAPSPSMPSGENNSDGWPGARARRAMQSLGMVFSVYLLLSLASLFVIALLGGQTMGAQALGAECVNGTSIAIAVVFFLSVVGVGLYALARSQAALASEESLSRGVVAKQAISLTPASLTPAAAGSERLLHGSNEAARGRV
jgi:hypothetical protein